MSNPYNEQNAINSMLREPKRAQPAVHVILEPGDRYRQGRAEGGDVFMLDTVGRESTCSCGGTGRAICDHLSAAMLKHLQTS